MGQPSCLRRLAFTSLARCDSLCCVSTRFARAKRMCDVQCCTPKKDGRPPVVAEPTTARAEEEMALLDKDRETVDAPGGSWICIICSTLIMGFVYGTAITKSHVWEPIIVRQMFAFETAV